MYCKSFLNGLTFTERMKLAEDIILLDIDKSFRDGVLKGKYSEIESFIRDYQYKTNMLAHMIDDRFDAAGHKNRKKIKLILRRKISEEFLRCVNIIEENDVQKTVIDKLEESICC